MNTVIKILFYGSTEKELHENLDTFWRKYTHLNHKNNPFDSNEFIWNSKDISDGNIHLWYQKYSLPSTKVLGFVAFRVTSKYLGIWSAERSWDDVKTIKSGKRSAIFSEISEKQIIVYTYDYTEEARIVRNISHTDSKDGSHSNYWNDDDHTFWYQLDRWGVDKLFHNSDEAITRELKLYIEDREKLNINNKSQLSCTMFLVKYISLALYDEDPWKIFIIDHKQLQFDKKYGWNLIGIPDKPNGTFPDHKYFCIHDDLFDIIQSTHRYRNIMWGFISNEPNKNESQSEATETHDKRIQNNKGSIYK